MPNDNGYYTSKPFITYDGIDENGVRAEVKVVKGYTTIKELEKDTEGSGSANVIFDNPVNPDYRVNGWARRSEDNKEFMEKIRKAYNDNLPIHFRLEYRRKDTVDRSLPMSEITPPGDITAAKNNIFKSVAAVMLDGDDEWTISTVAVTRIEEDPAPGGLNRAYDHSLEELKGKKKEPQNTNSEIEYSRSLEAPPYMVFNKDGNINPGSYAVAGPISFLNFIETYCREHEIEAEDEQIKDLAVSMTRVANKMQKAVYRGALANPDLSLTSHTRARSILYDVVKTYYPITEDLFTDKKATVRWMKNVNRRGLEIWQWSIEVVQKFSETEED